MLMTALKTCCWTFFTTKEKLWLLPGIPPSVLAALCTRCVGEGPVTQAGQFILDLRAARGPTYCCLRPHYQHLLF